MVIISSTEWSQIYRRPAGKFALIDYLAVQSSKMTYDSCPGAALSPAPPTSTSYICSTFICYSSGQKSDIPKGNDSIRWNIWLPVSLKKRHSPTFLRKAGHNPWPCNVVLVPRNERGCLGSRILGRTANTHSLAWEFTLLYIM